METTGDAIEYEGCYNYNNILYSVVTTSDVHERLQNGIVYKITK